MIRTILLVAVLAAPHQAKAQDYVTSCTSNPYTGTTCRTTESQECDQACKTLVGSAVLIGVAAAVGAVYLMKRDRKPLSYSLAPTDDLRGGQLSVEFRW